MPQYNGEHEDVLRPFVDAMRHKLASNKHKAARRWQEDSPETLLERLKGEVQELEDAIKGGNTVEMLLEAADVGNYSMMVATVAIALAAGGQGSGEHSTPPPLPGYKDRAKRKRASKVAKKLGRNWKPGAL